MLQIESTVWILLTLLPVTGGRIITGGKKTHNTIAITTKNKTNPK